MARGHTVTLLLPHHMTLEQIEGETRMPPGLNASDVSGDDKDFKVSEGKSSSSESSESSGQQEQRGGGAWPHAPEPGESSWRIT